MPLTKRVSAEFIGTFWLVFGGCGSAVLSASFPLLGIGFLGVSLAFGLTVLTMAYALGHISGCHLNPAVSLGLWAGKRFPSKDLLPYIVAQVIGAIVAGGVLLVIASGQAGFDLQASGLAANGYAEHSPGGYTLLAAIVTELVLTFMFLLIILGATDGRAPEWLCADCHRPLADAHSPDRDSGHQPVGQPRTKHRPRRLCGRLGTGSAVALLGGTDHRSPAGRVRLLLAVSRSR